MKHIYISSIVILTLAPQLVFAIDFTPPEDTWAAIQSRREATSIMRNIAKEEKFLADMYANIKKMDPTHPSTKKIIAQYNNLYLKIKEAKEAARIANLTLAKSVKPFATPLGGVAGSSGGGTVLRRSLGTVGRGFKYVPYVPVVGSIATGKFYADIFGNDIRRTADRLTGFDTTGTRREANRRRAREQDERDLIQYRKDEAARQRKEEQASY